MAGGGGVHRSVEAVLPRRSLGRDLRDVWLVDNLAVPKETEEQGTPEEREHIRANLRCCGQPSGRAHKEGAKASENPVFAADVFVPIDDPVYEAGEERASFDGGRGV